MSAYIPKAKREDWRTPPEVVALVREVFDGSIDLDPCAPEDPKLQIADSCNLTGPHTGGRDGLAEPWCGSVYVNYPFGDRRWIGKSAAEALGGAEIILLMPARTDTKAWHQYVSTASAVCLWRGRHKFVGAKNGAPFPTAFVYWGPRIQRFREVFGPHGMVFRP